MSLQDPTVCTDHDVKAQLVPAPTIVGRSAACVGDPTPTQIAPQNGYIVAEVCLETPDYFTESGRNDPAVPLIEGYEVLYHRSASATLPPTTSVLDTSGYWTRALDPLSPTNPKPVIPFGTDRADVALPGGTGDYFWLATRLVYVDCSVNGSTTVRPSFPAAGPRCTPVSSCSVPTGASARPLGSFVSSHCGPIR